MKSLAPERVSVVDVEQERESERKRVDDLRGDRTGFPLEVAQELTALRSHFAELHSRHRSAPALVAQDDWNGIGRPSHAISRLSLGLSL